MKITARPGLPRLLEQAPDPRRAPADEHLDEARARGGEEVDPRLGGDRTREHRLAGAGRAEEEDAAGRLRAEGREPIGVAEPRGDVHQLVFGRVDSLDLLPEDGLGLARLDRLRLGRAERPAQQRDEDESRADMKKTPKIGYQSKKKLWMSAAAIG